MPYREIPPTQVHPLELWSGGVSAEIKIMGGAPQKLRYGGPPRKLKYGGGGRPKSLPTHPPYYLNGIALTEQLIVLYSILSI